MARGRNGSGKGAKNGTANLGFEAKRCLFKVLVPPQPLLHAMTRLVEPRIEAIMANRVESRALAALRDTLLPKLLSGDISSSSATSDWVVPP